jgi:DNA-binding PadR family transcriptional regulator
MHQSRFWGGHRGERIFHKGDFKYLILDLLKEKPRHGYEIIREMEEKFGGFYTPSPGAVYPNLQWLEDMNYVTVQAQDGKKIYTITEEGLKFLSEKEKETEEVKKQMKDWWGSWNTEFRNDMRDVMRSLGDLGRMIGQKTRQAGQDKFPQVKEVIADAVKEIERIFKS